MWFFDPHYLIYVGPAILLAMWAQYKVKGAYQKYSQVRLRSGLSGAEVAQRLLRQAGIYDVNVKAVGGELSDNYDPGDKTLNLSQGVYNSSSVAAAGIAAHEVGHAIQDNHSYVPLKLRNAIIPATQLGSRLSMPLLLIGIFLHLSSLVTVGIIFFSLAVAFQLITLPVEFNASNRARRLLAEGGYITEEEVGGVRSVLSAAAMTYLAAALVALTQLLYFIGLARDE